MINLISFADCLILPITQCHNDSVGQNPKKKKESNHILNPAHFQDSIHESESFLEKRIRITFESRIHWWICDSDSNPKFRITNPKISKMFFFSGFLNLNSTCSR